MSKSIPINQLPQQLTNNGLVTDQQKQIISQTQNAIKNSTMPQNTQFNNDINDDDDATIQEVLNSISSGTQQPSLKQTNEVKNFEQQNEKSSQNDDLLEQHKELLRANQILQQMNMNNNKINENENTLDNLIMNSGKTNNVLKTSIAGFTYDVKYAIIIFIIVVLIHFIPLDKYLAKYFSIEKIPYHLVLTRGLMAVILVLTTNKYILEKFVS